MKGQVRTERENKFEVGTHVLELAGASFDVGTPHPKYVKAGKTPKECAYIQVTLYWNDEEGNTLYDSFLKVIDGMQMSTDAKYKSRFQKRLEQLLSTQLKDEDGPRLEVKVDFVDSWDDLKAELLKEDENGDFGRANIESISWDGHKLFGHKWIVSVQENSRGYTEVVSVAALPKEKRKPKPTEAAPPPAPAENADADTEIPF